MELLSYLFLIIWQFYCLKYIFYYLFRNYNNFNFSNRYLNKFLKSNQNNKIIEDEHEIDNNQINNNNNIIENNEIYKSTKSKNHFSNIFGSIMNLSLNRKLYFNYSLFVLTFFDKKTLVYAATISKCFYEGDFTVYCNRSKLPSTLVSDSVEVMRYAKVINGLQHNDTLCSYIPGASCARTLTLSHCFDKPSCSIKNNWFSLEPDCPGNSYYTQFEYDCQPAFYMCDKDDLIKNAFSGLIYSPSYPNTFRSERSDPCYLTIKLPKNHHAEITLEYFDLLGTSKCIGDYLEIQQYVDTSGLSKSLVKRSNHKNLTHHKNSKSFTGGFSNYNTNNNYSNSYNKIVKLNKQQLKTARQQRRPNFKWHTLGTMCGQIEKAYTIRATANTINFKFRPLPANHPYLTSSLSNHTARHHLGFKIYFQAIPPKDINSDFDYDSSRSPHSQKELTTALLTNTSPTDINEHINTDNLNEKKSTFNISNWLIILIASVISLLVIVLIIIGLIIFIKKRGQSSTKASSQNSKPKLIDTAPNNVPKPGAKIDKKKPINFEESDDSSPQKNSSSAKLETTPVQAPQSANKTKIVLEPEPRKMQAERPVLLQDLSQSKLLLKFKQQSSVDTSQAKPAEPPQSTNNNNTNGITNNSTKGNETPKKSEQTVDTPTSQQKTKINGVTENKDQSTPKKIDSKKLSINTGSNGGVYGTEIYDGGGVYGADVTNIVTNKPVFTIASSTKPSSANSTKKNSINSINKTNENEDKPASADEKTASTAKNRKTSQDNVDDVEKMYLMTASSEINDHAKKNLTEEINQTILENNNHNDDEKSKLIVNEIDEKQTITPKLKQPNELNLKEPYIKSIIKNSNSDYIRADSYNSNDTIVTFSTAPMQSNSSSLRKPAFNPLHVILKDKNKYHTTEYI